KVIDAGSTGSAPVPAAPAAPSSTPAPVVAAPLPVAAPAPAPMVPAVVASGRSQAIPFNNIRLRTGEHMIASKAAAPHVLTVVEVDYEGVERARAGAKAGFKDDEGFSLTYLPFIARAVIDALREYPHLNATVGDGELIVHNDVNLSVAVDLDFQGLLAPVVRGADAQRLRGLARAINDVAGRARSKQLVPNDLSGGTFTLTNMGSYGTFIVSAVINQPQVAILSTDGISRKPVVVTDGDGNEAIAVHSVGMLALSWDHRAFDGAYAAAFMAKVREIIQTRDWAAELT
ncbi:MAG: 2-oxo acid dehydrogenase subunit E2, partial [Acidimicrobiales bacterium]